MHTGGLYLKQKVQSEKEEVVSGGESNWATLDGSLQDDFGNQREEVSDVFIAIARTVCLIKGKLFCSFPFP